MMDKDAPEVLRDTDLLQGRQVPDSLGDAIQSLRRSPLLSVPIIDPETGQVIAVLARPDALTPPIPPRLGGMATPLGVYLTDGVSSGGAGFWGLFLTGVIMSLFALTAQAAVHGLSLLIAAHPAFLAVWFQLVPLDVRFWLAALTPWLPLPFVFFLLRVAPLSGTHAAEHQVVHCIERFAPLVPETVRSMPRVHPRCGTNLFTGFTLFLLTFVSVFSTTVQLGWQPVDSASLGAIIAAPLTLFGWRRTGSWVQRWFATRPATDKQIAGAIRAAEQVLSRRRARLERSGSPRFAPIRRLWSMGLAQIILGYCLVLSLLTGVLTIWPNLAGWLGN